MINSQPNKRNHSSNSTPGGPFINLSSISGNLSPSLQGKKSNTSHGMESLNVTNLHIYNLAGQKFLTMFLKN